MNKRIFLPSLILTLAFAAGSVFTGCQSPKNVAYFQDVRESVYSLPESRQIRIEPYNALMIVVKSKDPGISQLFNKTLPYDRVGDGYSDYSVSASGTIEFPVLGEIKVEGMTRTELASYIKEELISKGYVKDPVVTVEIGGASFSVLGEVTKSGYYSINKDNLNILEALAMAGDLTLQGQRDNVKIIRKDNEGVHTYVVDLTNFSQLRESPAFLIKQGDVIYVEPNNVKKRETTINGNNVMNISFWVSIASLLTSIAVLVK